MKLLPMRKALIVEDDPDIGSMLAAFLHQRNFVCQVLPEGKTAVFWARENLPHLVLLDLMLPDIDGYTVCQELKRDQMTHSIPVIMVTARAQPQDRLRGLEIGAAEYVTKPFTEDQLLTAIDRVMACKEGDFHGSHPGN